MGSEKSIHLMFNGLKYQAKSAINLKILTLASFILEIRMLIFCKKWEAIKAFIPCFQWND